MFYDVIAIRTESPDNDSAFSDSVSLFSSESSTSSSTTPSTHNNHQVFTKFRIDMIEIENFYQYTIFEQ